MRYLFFWYTEAMKFMHVLREIKRHATTLLFVGGFIFDLIILPKAGHIATIIIGFVYLSVVGASIGIREWVISRNTASRTEQKLFEFFTFAIAYFSGSALSFISVYAIRSAEISVSWPLLVILLLCVLANEFIASHHFRFTLDVGVFLLATLFFVVFNLPVVLQVQNDMTFVISMGISMGISFLYLFVLTFTSESAEEEAPRLYALAFGIPMFIGMLYFLNVIPAVPLSLANAGIYHSVVHTDLGEFIVTKETDTRILSSLRTPVYHLSATDNGVYFFSSVQAPALLSAPITHVWEYYDTEKKKWVEKAVIAFSLAGGREDGYRAYSQKEFAEVGLWRVTVKVDSKRIIGRVKFYIVKETAETTLIKATL